MTFTRARELLAVRMANGDQNVEWRMSLDVAEALATEAHMEYTSGQFLLFGFQARVDDTLPPNSLLCDSTWAEPLPSKENL